MLARRYETYIGVRLRHERRNDCEVMLSVKSHVGHTVKERTSVIHPNALRGQLKQAGVIRHPQGRGVSQRRFIYTGTRFGV